MWKFGNDPGRGVNEICGLMGARRVTPGAGHLHPDPIRGTGDRTVSNSNRSGWHRRIDMERKNRLHSGDDSLADQINGATWNRFLCGLEDHTNRPRELQPGECSSQPGRDRGVRVVSACMHDAGDLRGKRNSGRLVNWEGIKICPECDKGFSGPDIHMQTDRSIPRHRLQTRRLQVGSHRCGRPEFGMAQLGVAMNGTPQCYCLICLGGNGGA